jgi:hypothetical protein
MAQPDRPTVALRLKPGRPPGFGSRIAARHFVLNAGRFGELLVAPANPPHRAGFVPSPRRFEVLVKQIY